MLPCSRQEGGSSRRTEGGKKNTWGPGPCPCLGTVLYRGPPPRRQSCLALGTPCLPCSLELGIGRASCSPCQHLYLAHTFIITLASNSLPSSPSEWNLTSCQIPFWHIFTPYQTGPWKFGATNTSQQPSVFSLQNHLGNAGIPTTNSPEQGEAPAEKSPV